MRLERDSDKLAWEACGFVTGGFGSFLYVNSVELCWIYSIFTYAPDDCLLTCLPMLLPRRYGYLSILLIGCCSPAWSGVTPHWSIEIAIF